MTPGHAAHGAPGPSVSPSSRTFVVGGGLLRSSPPRWSPATSSSASATSSTSRIPPRSPPRPEPNAAGRDVPDDRTADDDRRPRHRPRRRHDGRQRGDRRRRRPVTADDVDRADDDARRRGAGRHVPGGRPGGAELPHHRRRQRGVHRSRLARTPAPSATARAWASAATRSWCSASTRRPTGSPCCRSPATSTSTIAGSGNQVADQLGVPPRRAAAADRHDLRELRRRRSTTTSRSTSAPSRRSSTPSAASPCRSSSRPATTTPGSTCPTTGLLHLRRRARPRLRALAALRVRGPAGQRQLAGGPVERPRAHLAPAGLHPPHAVEHPRRGAAQPARRPRPDPRRDRVRRHRPRPHARRGCSSSPA